MGKQIIVKTIPTKFGPTKVTLLGGGPPLVVLHGGPGMDQQYLKPYLLPILQRRQLILFDQLGCGVPLSIKPVDYPSTLEHVKSVISYFAPQRPALFGHSWGALLAIQCASRMRQCIKECILVCPMPLTAKRLRVALGTLSQRFSEADQVKVKNLLGKAAPGSGLRLLRIWLPYYFAHPKMVKRMKVPQFNLGTNRSVMQSLGAFDLRASVRRIEAKVSVITGERDFISTEQVQELLGAAQAHRVIPEAGHFPFAERPSAFTRCIHELLD
jgi:proline iminopeptidase